jgi:hypothetical protein
MGSKKKRHRHTAVEIKIDAPAVTSRGSNANPPISIQHAALSKAAKRTLVGLAVFIAVGASVYAIVSKLPHRHNQDVAVRPSGGLLLQPSEPPGFDGSYIPTSLTYDELMKLAPNLLDKVNVGYMDLLCSQGLPGSENLNVDDCLNQLSYWASEVQRAEDSNSYRYDQSSGLYRHSMAYFKAVIMMIESPHLVQKQCEVLG